MPIKWILPQQEFSYLGMPKKLLRNNSDNMGDLVYFLPLYDNRIQFKVDIELIFIENIMYLSSFNYDG